jgi:membrane fusion protein (multidrug efflux system)
MFNTNQKLIAGLTVITLLLSSCGGKKPEDLAGLKAKQAELKTSLAEVSAKISKLEGDSGKKFVLVEANSITPSIFKTYINAQGRIDAEESVSLSSEMPGTVVKINVKPGDQVSKGQVLAETDARAVQQQLAAYQTSLSLVNQLYEKQKALWDQKIGTEVQYLQLKTSKEAAEAGISAVQEQLKMTKIISPIDGTVDGVDIKLGQAIAPGMSAIKVVNFKNLKVKADLAESYAAKVHIGDQVFIKFPDISDTVSARVSYSSRAINPLNRTFGVEVLLDTKHEYHPNQITILQINDYRSAKPVISLPVIYLQKDLKGENFVMVAENNKAAKRFVKTGKEYNGNIEITEGLTEADKVITNGYVGLNEGDVIKVKTAE